MTSNKLSAPQQWLTDAPKILVIGAGGTGSEFLSRLFKLNFLVQQLGATAFDVTVADGDAVSEFNIGRQNYYPCDIGMNKAEVIVNRFNAFSTTKWKHISSNIDAEDLACSHRLNYDLIVTCVDSGKFRASLGENFCHKDTDCLWIDGGNDASSGQVVIGHLGVTDKKIPNVWDLFGSELKTATTNNQPSCSTEDAIRKQTFGINSQIAEAMCQLLWQLLRKGSVTKSIVYVDVNKFDMCGVDIDPKQWELYGYKEAV